MCTKSSDGLAPTECTAADVEVCCSRGRGVRSGLAVEGGICLPDRRRFLEADAGDVSPIVIANNGPLTRRIGLASG